MSEYSSSGAETTPVLDGMNDCVCIVGLACRLPGDVRSSSSLWELLANKRCAQGQVPLERFNVHGFHCADDNRAGGTSADGGYFLSEDVRSFENSFFGINNLEATYMDPLQRKLLEVVFECLENAGVPLDQISGTKTGVYIGDFTTDYQTMHLRDPDYLHRYSSTGASKSILANRISHAFNLQGPSLTLNTACSSSIYCLHTAVSALYAGDCTGAIVAAANLILAPEQHLETMRAGILSKTSACHTFDASADGYGRAEGVNAIYIKRLSSALKDGDKIWGVIRATALNANGKTSGISQPDPSLQEAVIRKAYAEAGLYFADTDYVECHGTGTAVGDVIEVDALKRCFSPREGPPLMIGSVKTNLGHSEAASGLTSIIKVLLAFDKDEIPPTYGVTKLNPKLNLSSGQMKVVTQRERWPKRLRRASINSFGYGGANAHVILESLGSYLGTDPITVGSVPEPEGHVYLLPISAASERSLSIRIGQISDLLRDFGTSSLGNLAYTLADRRSHLDCRATLLTRVTTEGRTEIVQVQESDVEDSRSRTPLPIAFVFTGQGAQYACMAKELLQYNDTFSATIGELDNVLKGLEPKYAPDWTLRQAILDPPETSRVNEATRSQPLCTAVQIGLVNVLKSWGVYASAVVGHSSGEIAAAYAAGLLDQSEAILAAYLRGYAVTEVEACGAMIAAGIDDESARALIDQSELGEEAGIACVNSPDLVTISGTQNAIEVISSKLRSQSKFCRKLETGGRAYHSPMMKAVGTLYEASMKSVSSGKILNDHNPTARMFSSVGYRCADLAPLCSETDMVRYWRDNLEKPVQFDQAIRNLAESGDYHLIEIGPHHALKSPVHEILASFKPTARSLPYSHSLVRNRDSDIALRELAGTLFLEGHKLNWSAVNSMPRGAHLQPLHNLPPYPWDYSGDLLWHEPRASVELRQRKYARHELLGTRQVAGNGIDWSWRNLLRLDEVPWLRDHKVENQVVFPATGYIAMALEAIAQLKGLRNLGLHESQLAFSLSNVSINAAFVVQYDDDSKTRTSEIELHTVMSPRRLSATTMSTEWYDFSISSWSNGQSTVHCVGGIRANEAPYPDGPSPIFASAGLKSSKWPVDRWYQKLEENGLGFGPHFQSLLGLATDASQTQGEVVSTVRVEPPVAQDSCTKYVVHPITIDACLQTAVFASAKGNLGSLQAYLPVFIAECSIQYVPNVTPEARAQIQTKVTRTSLSTQNASCRLSCLDGEGCIDMRDIRLSLYMGDSGENKTIETQRNPCLRVYWKPDILRLSPRAENQLRRYIHGFITKQALDQADGEALAVIGALLDLSGHRNPAMRVLELGASYGCRTKQWLDMLGNDTAFPRYGAWNTGSILDQGAIAVDGNEQGPFDVLVISEHPASEHLWQTDSAGLFSVVSAQGTIICRRTEKAFQFLNNAGFTVVDVGSHILAAARNIQKLSQLAGRDVLIVFREVSSYVEEFARSLESALRQIVGLAQIRSLPLSRVRTTEISEKTVYISLLEVESELLATINQEDMDLVRFMTNTATDLLYVIGANTLGASGQADPNMTLASGLSRALMAEQPSLRFSIVDIGSCHQVRQDIAAACQSIISALVPLHDQDDKEFVYSAGLMHISRFGPDPILNALFRRRLGMEGRLKETTLAKAGTAQWSIDKIGQTDTIYFQKLCEPTVELPAGHIDVIVKAVSLNAKDIYSMSGRVETRKGTLACEFSGVVKVTAGDVTTLKPGDRVVVMMPNRFKTVERVPAWAAHKLLPSEGYCEMATIPIVYSTALYALHDRAKLRRGESVLIHAGSGALGIAAIGIAQSYGGVVFATASSPAKKAFLEANCGIPASHIFSSRDSSFVSRIMTMTGGRGVDVVINSLVGDLLHASWSCLANFGRFVEVGKRELVDAGRLDMRGFLRNATFTAFDLEELILSKDQFHQNIVYGKVEEALKLYRSGDIQLPPIAVFDISAIGQAYRYFSTKDRVGKVVISLEDPKSHIQAAEPEYLTVFNPEKVYLLVGCLGGLGRSLSCWMAVRGARNFVFLGRSGCNKPDAQELVLSLRSRGASVSVVKGDVANASDVVTAVKACTATGKPIGGVVQAAMGLREALFSQMTSEAWHVGIDCKWAGTWNLHRTLDGHDLDFFLLTSSNSGSIGVATEANYCASNAFLDAFARWRHSQGKPTVSVGLGVVSEVGYLHENPDIEAILMRRGFQAIPEDEFLQLIDLALWTGGNRLQASNTSDHAAAHILTGLESVGFHRLLEQGYDVNNLPMQDPRSSILAESLAVEQKAMAARQGVAKARGQFVTLAEKANLSQSLQALISESDTSIGDTVSRLMRKQFSNLILIPPELIDICKPLATFGLDSMLAAEFRSWLWATFKVNVPFLDLLSSQRSLASLSRVVESNLEGNNISN
ncbi:hypothetical protein Hte_003742 [Hypoxylon texense]